jgi:hypothetical protein
MYAKFWWGYLKEIAMLIWEAILKYVLGIVGGSGPDSSESD